MEWYFVVLIAAVVYALGMIATKKGLVKEHSIEFLAVHSLLVAAFSMPLLFFIKLNMPLNVFLLVYALSWIFTIALFYNTKAVHHLEISIVAPLMTLGPAITSILAVFLLKEFLNLQQIVGIAVLLAGAYILQSKPK